MNQNYNYYKNAGLCFNDLYPDLDTFKEKVGTVLLKDGTDCTSEHFEALQDSFAFSTFRNRTSEYIHLKMKNRLSHFNSQLLELIKAPVDLNKGTLIEALVDSSTNSKGTNSNANKATLNANNKILNSNNPGYIGAIEGTDLNYVNAQQNSIDNSTNESESESSTTSSAEGSNKSSQSTTLGALEELQAKLNNLSDIYYNQFVDLFKDMFVNIPGTIEEVVYYGD